jgi:SAM-dependent methyltransferase
MAARDCRRTEARQRRLRLLSILDVDERLGTFDYVVCHGVYSWVPPAVQQKILAICAERLSPHGVAYVSYNTYPGWHLRSLIRDLLRWRAGDADEPHERLRSARGFLDLVARARTPLGTADALQRAPQEEAADLENAPRRLRLPRALEDHNEPCTSASSSAARASTGSSILDDARPATRARTSPPSCGRSSTA